MKNPLFGLIGGVVAALLGAALWAVITVNTGWQIGFMAIGVGFLCGIAVAALGGSGPVNGMIGAGTALAGCVLGNILSGIGFLAQHEGIGFTQMLGQFNWAATPELLGAMFSPIDLLFYAIAIFQGFKIPAAADSGVSED